MCKTNPYKDRQRCSCPTSSKKHRTAYATDRKGTYRYCPVCGARW